MTDLMSARIAVIADTSLQRHVLQQALTANGYRVILNTDPARLEADDLAQCEADLWLVDLAQSEDSPLVDSLLEKASSPVLFGEGHAPERNSEHYPRWERRLFGKLKRLVGDPSRAVGPTLEALLAEARNPARLTLPQSLAGFSSMPVTPARQVWLLAASMGGPEAVKAFLDALPGGLPVGFVYAQHIEESFEATLPQAVGRHSQCRCSRPRRPAGALWRGGDRPHRPGAGLRRAGRDAPDRSRLAGTLQSLDRPDDAQPGPAVRRTLWRHRLQRHG